MKLVKRLLERKIDADEKRVIQEAESTLFSVLSKAVTDFRKDDDTSHIDKSTIAFWREKAEVYDKQGYKDFATVYTTAVTEYENFFPEVNSPVDRYVAKMTAISRGHEKVGNRDLALMYKVVAYVWGKVGDKMVDTMTEGHTWDLYRRMAREIEKTGDKKNAEILRAYATAVEKHEMP